MRTELQAGQLRTARFLGHIKSTSKDIEASFYTATATTRTLPQNGQLRTESFLCQSWWTETGPEVHYFSKFSPPAKCRSTSSPYPWRKITEESSMCRSSTARLRRNHLTRRIYRLDFLIRREIKLRYEGRLGEWKQIGRNRLFYSKIRNVFAPWSQLYICTQVQKWTN